MKDFKRRLLHVTLIDLCVGFFEAVFVIYLRKIYYPSGFSFPLRLADPQLGAVEMAREAVSIVLLWGIGALAGKSFKSRFGWFAFCFGVWDMVYYIVLKMFLDWPESFLTWDILFLLPLPWLGPILAPVLVSAALIVCGLMIVRLEEKGIVLNLSWKWWTGEILCGLVIIFTFIQNFRVVLEQGVPRHFNWPVFLIALVAGIILFAVTVRKSIRLLKIGV